jgi:hypothetical protein
MKIDLGLHKLLTLPTSVMFTVFITTGLILFLPDSILGRVESIINFKDTHHAVILITFIFTVVVIILRFLYETLHFLFNLHEIKKMKHNLRNMTNNEKSIFTLILHSCDHTNKLPYANGTVQSLKRKKIIYRTSNNIDLDRNGNRVVSYSLAPWVIKEINTNDELKNTFYYDE